MSPGTVTCEVEGVGIRGTLPSQEEGEKYSQQSLASWGWQQGETSACGHPVKGGKKE